MDNCHDEKSKHIRCDDFYDKHKQQWQVVHRVVDVCV